MNRSAEYFEKNMEICIINGRCTNDSAIFLFSVVKKIFNHECADNSIWNVEYYRYQGNTRAIRTVYKENEISKEHFQYNNSKTVGDSPYFLQSDNAFFMKTENRILIFEIQYSEMKTETYGSFTDVSNFAYLSLLFQYLQMKNANFRVQIMGAKTSERLYNPIDNNAFYKLRTFLMFQCSLLKENDFIYCITDNYISGIRMYRDELISVISDMNRPNSALGESTFGVLLPLIPINKDTFICLQERANVFGPWRDVWAKRLNELMLNYYKKVVDTGYIPQEKLSDLENYLYSDSLLEALIFYTSLYYLYIEFKETVSDISLLHERCVDYVQGINQTLENVYYHVVCSKGGGTGNIAIRIRKKSDSYFEFLALEKEENETRDSRSSFIFGKYIIEINIVDVCYEEAENLGIVDKFYENVRKYYPTHPLLKTKDSTKDRILLENLFGVGENKILDEYLNNPKNIAYHYGLQIFENAVSTNHGAMGVWSGNNSNNTFFNDERMSKMFSNGCAWSHGTAYMVCIPLSLTEEVDYTDSIGISEYDILSVEIEKTEFTPDVYRKADFGMKHDEILMALEKVGGKNELVDRIVVQMQNEIKDTDMFCVIDCADIHYECQYEIVAKVVFRCLTSKEIQLRHMAIINLASRYDVIKLFRQFAMFYNRDCKCEYLDEKTIFIVDDSAKLSLFLRGRLKDIIKDMKEQQIIGGIDESEMKIIKHLGGRNGK